MSATRYQIKVKDIYLQMILSGKKNVEGRIAKPKYKNLKVGDILEFHSENNTVETKVIDLKNFISFKEMINYFGVQSCIPDLISTTEEAVNIYHSFPKYKENEVKFGVMGIKISLI